MIENQIRVKVNKALMRSNIDYNKKKAFELAKEAGIVVQQRDDVLKLNMAEELEQYFANTPHEKIKADWDALAYLDNVGPTVDEWIAWQSVNSDMLKRSMGLSEDRLGK